MLVMFARRLEPPNRSFFLLGPRGTGKTTWLRHHFPSAVWYNLLLEDVWAEHLRDTALFRHQVSALPSGSWVVVDEVQRLPRLLNDVHEVLSHSSTHVRFALTGSSARKLRHQDVNLLAGRALTKRFFPLSLSELSDGTDIESLLKFGGLPAVASADKTKERVALLEAYHNTYLAEEIRNEGLVRRLDSFQRFLGVAGLMNAQVTNVASIARDAGVSRQTVQGYFDVLVDTLVGTWLPTFHPNARVREVGHPKFYFFDPGVVRGLTARLREPLDSAERGALFETWVLHELRSFAHDADVGGQLSYWRIPSGHEVDFIWSRGSRHIGIEAKASARWRSQDSIGLKTLLAERKIARAIGVYLGSTPLRDGAIEILPIAEFSRRLESGEIIPTDS